MRKRTKRKQPSLEQELKRLAAEKIAKDPKGRSRAELLASALWNRSLSGDKDALRMLLERLPISPQDVEPRQTVEENIEPTFEAVTTALRSLVTHGILSADAFSRFAIGGVED